MAIHRTEITIETRGECDVIDSTAALQESLQVAGGGDGTAHCFTPGATAAITAIEFEPGAVRDFQEAIERIAPRGGIYHHNERWGDGNGFSHLRAALLGPSMSVPIEKGRLLLGTWQQIVLVDFDNRPRSRRVVLTITTE